MIVRSIISKKGGFLISYPLEEHITLSKDMYLLLHVCTFTEDVGVCLTGIVRASNEKVSLVKHLSDNQW